VSGPAFRLASGGWSSAPSPDRLNRLTEATSVAAGDRDREWAAVAQMGAWVRVLEPGTASHFTASLAAVASVDLTVARMLEPHLDALGILTQAGCPVPDDSTWGVFAAEAPGATLEADDAGTLTGRKAWCSLAGELSHALVTARTTSGARGLYAVDLRQTGVRVHDADGWTAKGLPRVPSTPVDFDAVPASPVGAPGWYLDRPGFALGGIGVAACWWGGAAGLVRDLAEHVEKRRDSELALLALGEAYAELRSAENAVATAAAAIDRGDVPTGRETLLAQLTRSSVRASADRIRAVTTQTIGPAALAFRPDYAQRVADLELYTAQDHGRRDLARLGRLVLDDRPW
jgi:hypothetical protein